MDFNARHLLILATAFALSLHALRRDRFWRTCASAAGMATIACAVWRLVAGLPPVRPAPQGRAPR